MADEDNAVLRHDPHGRPVYRTGRAPDGLVTAAQLRAAGWSDAGLEPAAWLYYSRIYHRVCALYRRADARPIRPLTDRQRAALAAGRALAHTVACIRCGAVRVPKALRPWRCERCDQAATAAALAAHERRLADDAGAAAAWAREALADPNLCVLDCETTGLGLDYVVEIAILAGDGSVLLETLVHPQMPIPDDATSIHGITDADVAAAPTFAEILPTLERILAGRRVVIQNAAFDTGILCNELDRHFAASRTHRTGEPARELPLWSRAGETQQWWARLKARIECAMQQHAAWFGDWSDYWGGYRWQPLGGNHRARGDCEALLARIHTMAEASTPQRVDQQHSSEQCSSASVAGPI